jgi:hypothetical protein
MEVLPLSSWHDWYLIASWILAVAYLGLAASRPQTNVGLFVLPIVLILTAIAWIFPQDAFFSDERAERSWAVAHGIMLLLGTVTVSFGFVAGLMYLVQSWRLKAHFSPQSRLKLPSLEWLQSVNKQSLVYSSFFIALGLVSGIILNVIRARGDDTAVPWTDGVVLGSALLLVWLIAATIFEWTYKPAQQGRKVAYLTIASFVFLGLVMAILLVSGHGGEAAASAPNASVPRQSTEYSVLSTQYSIRNPQSAIRNRPIQNPKSKIATATVAATPSWEVAR